ncbi:MAG: hypothetical protein HYY84_07265 [Deltaproteobacteria bacterium]|nr:hypothetical protein [Deltaproteobacteria bacterium]
MKKWMAPLALVVASCGSEPIDLGPGSGDVQALFGEWKQADPVTGRVKVRITAREDGTFLVDEVERNKQTVGTFSVVGQTLTFNRVKDSGERISASAFFYAADGTLAFGEGVLLAESQGAGFVRTWTGFEQSETRDATGSVISRRSETTRVTVRADGTISLASEKTGLSSTSAPTRSGREGRYTEIAEGKYRVTWAGETRSFVVRLVGGGAFATDESIFTR